MQSESDEQLLDRLRRLVAQADPVPSHVDEAARAALSTRHLDELARLLADSDEGAAVLTRGRAGEVARVRLLTFGGQQAALELQVTVEGEGATVRGLLTGPLAGTAGPVTIEVRGRTPLVGEVDEDGFFTVAGVPLTFVRLRVGATTTEWFTP
jgi:hypothetical protein